MSAGDPLGTLEAMKMELALTAPFDGTVTQVGAAVGDQVALGHVLFTVEATTTNGGTRCAGTRSRCATPRCPTG